MSSPASISPRARRDLEAALRRIAADNPDAASRMVVAVDAAARRIGLQPLGGLLRPELTADRYRFWSLQGFPYHLVSDVTSSTPRGARIVHMARDLPNVLRTLKK